MIDEYQICKRSTISSDQRLIHTHPSLTRCTLSATVPIIMAG